MSVPILTAVGDPGLEAQLTATLSSNGHGVEVVRRCVDLADVLATAAAGLAGAVVLSADLRRLDREAVTRLEVAMVAVVALVPAGDAAAEHRLRQLGVRHVLADDAPAAAVAAEVHAAVAELTAPSRIEPAITGQLPDPVVGTGKVVAVWGPAGAPGRSTIALNLAAELALADNPTLLVDADTYGGVLAQLVGVLDEAPGIAAACRLASAGGLDVARLAGVALEVRPALCLLSSITRADRWLELRPSALGVVLTLARTMAAYTVVDCGFCLEQEGEASYDTAAPRRNGATLAALAAADVVVAVAAADPVGLARYVRALPECLALTAAPVTIPVANRLRRRVIGPGDPRREVSAALERYAGITAVHCVPDDGEALDIALANGKTLLEAAPKSPARLAIKDLASVVAGDVTVQRGRRRR